MKIKNLNPRNKGYFAVCQIMSPWTVFSCLLFLLFSTALVVQAQGRVASDKGMNKDVDMGANRGIGKGGNKNSLALKAEALERQSKPPSDNKSPLDTAKKSVVLPKPSLPPNKVLQNKKNKDMEKIKITGSRIQRINMEGSSPTIVLSREDMEKTGYNSIADILRDMTVSSFGSLRESPGSTSSGVALINLRGLGADRTLVLMDGKRVQRDPLKNAVDLNLISLAAVERIEILKDSASAIYGSEALGGVVNIITRKNFSGHEASVKQLISEGSGGNQTEVGLTSGASSGRWSATGILHHRSNEAIYDIDRKYSRLRLSPLSSPATFRVLKSDKKTSYTEADGKTLAFRSRPQASPSCPTDRVARGYGGTVCQANYASHLTNRPSLEQTSAMLNTNFQVRDDVNTFFRLHGAFRNVQWAYSPTPIGSFSGHGISGRQAKIYAMEDPQLKKIFEGLRDDDFVEVNSRLMELGDRQSDITTHQYGTLAGVTLEKGDTWEIEISAGYNQSFTKNVGANGYARSHEVQQRLDTTGFNPFASPGTRGDLSELNYQTWTTSMTSLILAEVSATGDIFQMPSGPVGLAIGTQAHREAFRIDSDEATKNDEIIGAAGGKLDGSRNVVSGYMELSLPLLPSVEWSLSSRYDAYSDFGQAFSPKTNIRWQVSPKVMVRSSIGRGFKAPNMDDLYKEGSHGFQTFIDHVLCQKSGGSSGGGGSNRSGGGGSSSGSACRPHQWKVISHGNTNLKEERSLSASLGAFVELTHGIEFGIDGWYLKLENEVGLQFDDMTMAEHRFGSQYLQGFGIHVERDPSTGQIKKVIAPHQNLSKRELSGVDLVTEVFKSTKWGDIALAVQHSHLLYNKTVGFSGLEKQDTLGHYGLPPWRNVVSLTYSPSHSTGIRMRGSSDHQTGTLVARTVAPHQKRSSKAGNHKQYTELDLQYTYNGLWGGSGSISMGIRNILATTPPVDDSNPSLPQMHSSLYDGNGRMGWLQYKYLF